MGKQARGERRRKERGGGRRREEDHSAMGTNATHEEQDISDAKEVLDRIKSPSSISHTVELQITHAF